MEIDELAKAAIAGDRRALARLYSLLRTDLGRYFTRRFGSSQVDDLVQSTLIAVFSKLREFDDRGEGSFLRWVHGFARYQAQRAMRERTRRDARHAAFERDPKSPQSNLSSKIEQLQRIAIMQREARNLRDLYRRAIENELDGGDAGTFAAQEKIGRGSARVVRSRAQKKLRELVRARMTARRPTTKSPSTPNKSLGRHDPPARARVVLAESRDTQKAVRRARPDAEHPVRVVRARG